MAEQAIHEALADAISSDVDLAGRMISFDVFFLDMVTGILGGQPSAPPLIACGSGRKVSAQKLDS